MRELVLKMSVSVDGYAAAERADSDWMFRAGTPDSAAWVLDTLSTAGTHIWGRKTFEFGAGFWPTSTGPMAGPTNAKPKVVFTRQEGYRPSAHGADDAWSTARVASGDLTAEVTRLKQEDGDFVLAQGGVEFVRSLIVADLVDEYRFVVLPVALGAGRRVFDGIGDERDLELVETRSFAGGALASTYRPRR